MHSKKILLAVFILVALAQVFIPVKMILDREDILTEGKEYRFRTAPVDPHDPFRGKYIRLNYKDDTVEIGNEKNWTSGEEIYVFLTIDKEGFAKIKSVSKQKPTDNQDYLKAKVSYVTINNRNKLSIDYPFDRFYMEESKAQEAELTYRRTQRDTSKTTYAVVNIKNGDAVLKDVMINGTSIREIVKARLEEKKE